MVTIPMPTKARVRRNRGQSKCEMRRRSICNDLSWRPGVLLILWLVFHFDVFLENFFCHGSSGFTAVPAVLNQHDDGDLWILDRRIGDEPGMIAVKVRELLALEISSLHLDNLRCAGFAGDRYHVRTRRPTGAASASHHIS